MYAMLDASFGEMLHLVPLLTVRNARLYYVPHQPSGSPRTILGITLWRAILDQQLSVSSLVYALEMVQILESIDDGLCLGAILLSLG